MHRFLIPPKFPFSKGELLPLKKGGRVGFINIKNPYGI